MTVPASFLALSALALSLAASAAAEDWTRFRGPNGSGVAAGSNYPAALEPATANWRMPVRPGKSSPVLTRDHIFLTAFDEGRLYTQCFRRDTGALVWERAVERNREADLNALNEPAAITPVTDGENVYVLFRDIGLFAYDSGGELLWSTPLEPFANVMGHASSPILSGGRVILQADQKMGSYIAAFDQKNGEIAWKTDRVEGEGWATPLAYNEGLLTISRGWIGAHASADGRRYWGLQSLSPAIVASPVLAGDRVYAFGYGRASADGYDSGFNKRDLDGDGSLTPAEYQGSAYMAGVAKYDGDRDGVLSKQEYMDAVATVIAPSTLVAFRLQADPAAPPTELWRHERSFEGVIPTALVYEDVIYLIKNGGILETLDAVSGESLKRGRLREAIGGYSSSPVAADGKIYFANEDGKVSVLAAGGDWEVLSTGDFGEGIFATPALSDGRIFLRTDEALYCFGERP